MARHGVYKLVISVSVTQNLRITFKVQTLQTRARVDACGAVALE